MPDIEINLKMSPSHLLLGGTGCLGICLTLILLIFFNSTFSSNYKRERALENFAEDLHETAQDMYETSATIAGDTSSSPVPRIERAKEVLNAKELPRSYTSGFGIEMPFGVMAMAMIGDSKIDLDTSGTEVRTDKKDLFDRRGFIYSMVKDFGLEQESENPIKELMNSYRLEEELAAGTIEAAGGTVDYQLSRGMISHLASPGESYVADLNIVCAGDDSIRNALWFTVVPGAADRGGGEFLTANKEANLVEFLSYFDFCR